MNIIDEHLQQSALVKQQAAAMCYQDILAATDLITQAYRSGCKLLLCGNGGSAADCQHMAAEFVSRLTKAFDRPALPAIALTTDTSFLTAFANDCGYENVFVRQIEALGKPGDVLLGISTSGSSANVMRAVAYAQKNSIHTIALTGQCQSGYVEKLSNIADITIAVPSANTQYIQETHLAIEHIICHVVERNLYGETRRQARMNFS
ncbi:MAG: SIS domain-containing protein [Caldilineaceae bacterium]|nr:SIS domain-containing protein [Caldilineaceae bacterium]